MRIVTAIFVAAHGVGYSIWFLSTWMPSVMGTSDNHFAFPAEAPATGPLGRALGMVSLAVLFGSSQPPGEYGSRPRGGKSPSSPRRWWHYRLLSSCGTRWVS